MTTKNQDVLNSLTASIRSSVEPSRDALAGARTTIVETLFPGDLHLLNDVSRENIEIGLTSEYFVGIGIGQLATQAFKIGQAQPVEVTK